MKKYQRYYHKKNDRYIKIGGFSLKKLILTRAFLLLIFMIVSSFAFFYSSHKEELTSIEEGDEQIKLSKIVEQYKALEKKLEKANAVLKDIQERDDYLYRTYFELKPISQEVRKGGFGGTDRYKNLKNLPDSKLVIEVSKKVDMLSKALIIESESLEEIAKRAKTKEKMLASIPAIQPIANRQLNRISSGYGMRIHPILKVGKMHWGIDFSAKIGTPIYATGNGVIKVRGKKGASGNAVVINHGYGYQTHYYHISRFGKYRVGQRVKRGDIIGYVGSTGLSTAPHLHYEVHKNGKKVNPITFFYKNISPDDYKKLYDEAEKAGLSMD